MGQPPLATNVLSPTFSMLTKLKKETLNSVGFSYEKHAAGSVRIHEQVEWPTTHNAHEGLAGLGMLSRWVHSLPSEVHLEPGLKGLSFESERFDRMC